MLTQRTDAETRTLTHALTLALARGSYTDAERATIQAAHDDLLLEALDAAPNPNRIEVFPRNVFGQVRIYPANEAARTLARMIGAETFQQRHLDLARELGLEVATVADPRMAQVVR